MKLSTRRSTFTASFFLAAYLLAGSANAELVVNDGVGLHFAGGNHLILAWHVDDVVNGVDKSSYVQIQHSADNGVTWSAPIKIFSVSSPQYRLSDFDDIVTVPNIAGRVVATFAVQDLINNRFRLISKVSNNYGATWQPGWNVALDVQGQGGFVPEGGCPTLTTIEKNTASPGLYLLTSVRSSATGNADIYLAKSSNGISWTSKKLAQIPRRCDD
jgi:hypothetical protein